MVNQLAAYLIEVIGWKVFLVKPEEANEKTYKLVCGKVAKKRFTDPKVPFDEDAFDKAGGNLGTTGCVSYMFSQKGVIVIEKEKVRITTYNVVKMA